MLRSLQRGSGLRRMSNQEAAEVLLDSGLARCGFKGVVFLSAQGEQLFLKVRRRTVDTYVDWL